MKKLILMALPLVVFSGIASASTPNCLTTNGDDWTFAELGATGCEIGDKIFSNFTGSSQNTTDVFTFFQSGSPALNTTIELSAGTESDFTSGFTFGYTVSVDPTVVLTAGKTASISNLTGNISDSANGSASTLTKTNNVNGCTLTVTDTGGTSVISSPGGGCGFSNPTTSVTIGETFAYTGGVGLSGVTGLQNTITQVLTLTSSTPEPMSMLLFGSGLLAVGFIGKKRFARK